MRFEQSAIADVKAIPPPLSLDHIPEHSPLFVLVEVLEVLKSLFSPSTPIGDSGVQHGCVRGAIHFVLVLCLRSKQVDPFSNGSTAFSSHALRTGSQDARKRLLRRRRRSRRRPLCRGLGFIFSELRVHLFRFGIQDS